MIEASANLSGKRLLIVEDDYVIATDLASFLEELGAEIIGPAGNVEDALELVEREAARIDGALLDINLGEEHVYPVADLLAARGVRFIFVTGYDAVVVPVAYATVPRCEKPVDRARLTRLLFD